MRYLILGAGTTAATLLVFIAIGIAYWASTVFGPAVLVAVAIAVLLGVAIASLEYLTDRPKLTGKEQAILDAQNRIIDQ